MTDVHFGLRGLNGSADAQGGVIVREDDDVAAAPHGIEQGLKLCSAGNTYSEERLERDSTAGRSYARIYRNTAARQSFESAVVLNSAIHGDRRAYLDASFSPVLNSIEISDWRVKYNI